ncbi:hypothetical protein L914_10876 [Phytophthora nicotianae]|uniref:Uncharacterized protein n=1 Tax=Phytophthora nicotianae TaxID=4792 RepID=W2N5H2_PHYNI|nr:hypothetical protein L914_10876 [Phytophthora nicotianae]
MPRGIVKSDTKATAKAAARKAHAKSSKRHSKGSALKEATKVASEAVDASGDSTASKRRSSRRSRSPSMFPDVRPDPRFACCEHSPGSEGKAKARSFHGVSGSSVGGHTPVPSEHSVDSLQSLASEHKSQAPEHSESPAEMLAATREANLRRSCRSPRALSVSPLYEWKETSDEEEESAFDEPREITNDLDRQQELFQAARQKPGGSEATRVGQGASIKQRGYWPPEVSFGADLFLAELKAPRGLIGDHTSKGACEGALVQKEPLFTDNVEADRCVLLAQHQILLKDFTTCRKKPENRGGVYLDMFWAWVETLKYSPTELQELREDRLLSKILDQRPLGQQAAAAKGHPEARGF